MMALASFLKLHYLIKTAMLVVVVTVYTTLMMVAFPGLFSQFQASSTTKVYLKSVSRRDATMNQCFGLIFSKIELLLWGPAGS